LPAHLALRGEVEDGVDSLAATFEVTQAQVVNWRALGQILLEAEDVAGEQLLGGDEHTAVELFANDDVVDATVIEETH
jgi:hypothetical protein